jgi:hypothetical protein
VALHGLSPTEPARSPAVNIKSRATQLQYPSPDNMSSPFSPSTTHSTSTFTGSASSSSTADFGVNYQQSNSYKRSNSDHSHPGQGLNPRLNTKVPGPQRHGSFGSNDSKPPEALYSRPPIQNSMTAFGLPHPNQQQPYMNNQSNSTTQPLMQAPYVNSQNFVPFTLPPPGFSPVATTSSASRDLDSSYAISSPQTSVGMDYHQRDSNNGQQSGPDMMLLDQMTAANTMPVFGGEGYSRSPFAIPDDFVAYLFSGQQFDSSSPMSNSVIGMQGYAK